MTDDLQLRIDGAVEHILEAERSHGVRAYAIGEEWAAVLALRSASLAQYVCGVNLVLAGRERERASRSMAEAARRRPSGRRVHTVAQAQELTSEAARHTERAVTAELAALAAVSASDLVAAHAAVAHMVVDEGVLHAASFDREWTTALDVKDRVSARRRKQQRWTYPRGRADQAVKTHGGLLPLARFDRSELGGAPLTRSTESGSPGTISSAVELIARWDLAEDPRACADPSVAALEAIRGVRRGEHTKAGPGTIAAMERSSRWNSDEYDELGWQAGEGDETLAHIAEMRERVSRLFDHFGRPLHPGTWEVHSERYHLDGHIDFVTADTIWDLKVSDSAPSRVDILQLLLYWAAFRDDPMNVPVIAHLGIYNPRLGTVWRVDVSEIPPNVVSAIEALALSDRP